MYPGTGRGPCFHDPMYKRLPHCILRIATTNYGRGDEQYVQNDNEQLVNLHIKYKFIVHDGESNLYTVTTLPILLSLCLQIWTEIEVQHLLFQDG